MSDKLFLIAIGGTGMRCLEAFTHLCAIGMFDNEEIEILTIDTDQLNGNKARSEELVRKYGRIKTSDGYEQGGTPNNDTFFSAKLNLHTFYTDYATSGRENYKNISKVSQGTPEQQRSNKLISDLFLDEDSVQEFNLAHGYRAQTHLGSHLMYHGVVEAARKIASGSEVTDNERSLDAFMSKLEASANGSRVFVFGSIFGGTGASSIPVIPKAFQSYIKARSGGQSTLDLSKSKFGSTLLTQYFAFKKPDAKQKSGKDNSVIADSSFFPLNSQAALQFYQLDPTVQRTYKRMYHVGWPVDVETMENSKEVKDETITGGEKQKNPCHITELICACAAYDFFRADGLGNDEKAVYVYRSAEQTDSGAFNFSFDDFVGSEHGKLFANRLGAFFALAHLTLSVEEGAFGGDGSGLQSFLNRLSKQKVTDYEGQINEKDCNEFNEYLKMFAYSFSNNGDSFNSGWLYQIRNSIAPGTFLFDSTAFAQNQKDLSKLDVGTLFKDEDYHWPKGGFMGSRYDEFVKSMIETKPNPEIQKVSTAKEKFLAHLYKSISARQAGLGQ
jgi:hypothetical protein